MLKEIRDEAKATNARLGSLDGRVEQTNVALGSLEGRVEQTNIALGSLDGRVEQINVALESLEGRVEQTNAALGSLDGRVEQTNVRLESLEKRTEFLQRRVTAGFEKLSGEISGVAQRLIDTEIRLATEVVGHAHVTGEVRDLLAHADLRNLASRVQALEDQLSGRGK